VVYYQTHHFFSCVGLHGKHYTRAIYFEPQRTPYITTTVVVVIIIIVIIIIIWSLIVQPFAVGIFRQNRPSYQLQSLSCCSASGLADLLDQSFTLLV